MSFFQTASFAIAAIAFLWTCSLCVATFNTTNIHFSVGKKVNTSYKTFQSYSKIQCTVKCWDEKRQNRCSVAEYNTATQSCYLSKDSQQDLLDTDDETCGVFLYANPQGMFRYRFQLFKSFACYFFVDLVWFVPFYTSLPTCWCFWNR